MNILTLRIARASILSADKDDQALDRAQTITEDLLRDPDLKVNIRYPPYK
jgi:hypothetical protein